MTARNSPCPCGSGKKFKHCHGSGPEQPNRAPKPADSWLHQARQALQQGQVDEALRHARRAPLSTDRFRLISHALINRRTSDDLKAARRELSQWARQEPQNPEPWKLRLETFLFSQDADSASRAWEQLSQRAPSHPATAYYRGIIAQQQGQLEAAEAAFAHALRSQGNISAELANEPHALAVAASMQMCEVAAGNFPGSAARQPEGMFDCQAEMSWLKQRLLEWDEWVQASATQPDRDICMTHSDAWYNLGCAEQAAYTADDRRIEYFDHAVRLNPEHELARLNRAFCMNYSTRFNPDDIYRGHLDVGEWLQGRHPLKGVGNARTASGSRLKIGYLSADFRRHSVAHFILPVLKSHDASQFETVLFYNDSREDDFTALARQHCARLVHVDRLNDEQLHRAITSAGIDILVELNGLTKGNRLAALALRAAPVQISWMGYPNTTGLDALDYRVVDAITDPPEHASHWMREQPLYMDPVFSVFDPLEEFPEVTSLPALSNGHVTLGSFNAMPKLNDALLRCWAEIMQRLPASRMLLKNIALGYEAPRQQLLSRFAAHGIDHQRIELVGSSQDKQQHLAHYSKVDIALDSFPYNGTTTTCDSLLMGVPVISLCGADHRSRVGASQMVAVGLESLQCADENAYMDTVVALANDLDRLQQIRSGLRQRMQDSPLMDATAFTRQWETKLKNAWAARCRQEENQ